MHFAQRNEAKNYVAKKVLSQYIKNIQAIYGSHVQKILLYGSYARGDYRLNSDIDIIILLDMSDVETRAYTDALIEMTYDFNLAHSVDIQPYAKSIQQFLKWAHIDPFLLSIKNEGIVLYEAA